MFLLAAMPCSGQSARSNLSSLDVFAAAEEAKTAGRVEDAVALYDALSSDPDPEVRAEARFRKGMLYAGIKRYTEAATAFRSLLDEKPEAVRVRLELARMLALMGEEGAARRQLRQARAAGLPPETSPIVEQFARALRSTRTFGGSIEVALAPDTNINRATEARTLDTVIAPLTLSQDARAQSGVGAKLGGQGFARMNIAPGLAVLPRLAGSATLYRQAAFNDVSASALIGLEWRRGTDRLSPSVGQTWRWYGGNFYARTQAISLDWLHTLGPRAQLVVSGSASRARYQQNALQDGQIYDLNLGYERALNTRAGVGITLSGTRQLARDPGYATVAGSVALSGWHEVGGTTLFASSVVRKTEGDARLFLFPERRREWLFSMRVGAILRKLAVHGFAPLMRIGYERNISTVGLYEYRRFVGDVGVNRAF